jgi:prefoldin subunit 5
MEPSRIVHRPQLLMVLLAVGVAAAAFAVGAAGAYALYEHRKVETEAAAQQQLTAELRQMRSQIDQLNAKLSELAARPEPQIVAPAPVVEPPIAAKPAASGRPVENQGLKKMQAQLDRQGKVIDQQGKALEETRSQLDSTRSDLSNARTELGGSIARTHEELVVLQKKGERNYYEFDIEKSKQFQHEGPLGLRLRKANAKHQYADLDLIVEDRTVTQKHVNLYQPAMFFIPDSPQPAELVINSISKDRIHGYVSSPKYRQSQLASASNPDGAGTAQTAASQPSAQQTQRQPLLQPQ